MIQLKKDKIIVKGGSIGLDFEKNIDDLIEQNVKLQEEEDNLVKSVKQLQKAKGS